MNWKRRSFVSKKKTRSLMCTNMKGNKRVPVLGKEKNVSNLKGYQTMTTLAKKVGGPGRLCLMTLGSGYIIIRGVEFGAKRIVKIIKKSSHQKQEELRVYKVHKEYDNGEGPVFLIDDEFKVLFEDEELVLIEIINDENNPYFISAEVLEKISDYTKAD